MRTQMKNAHKPDPNGNNTQLRERTRRVNKQVAGSHRNDSIWGKIFAQLTEDGVGLIVSFRRWIERQDRRFDVPNKTKRLAC
jgi:hypothetical protein